MPIKKWLVKCEPWEVAGGGLEPPALLDSASGGRCCCLRRPGVGVPGGPLLLATAPALGLRRRPCPSWTAQTPGSSGRRMRQPSSRGSIMASWPQASGSSLHAERHGPGGRLRLFPAGRPVRGVGLRLLHGGPGGATGAHAALSGGHGRGGGAGRRPALGLCRRPLHGPAGAGRRTGTRG